MMGAWYTYAHTTNTYAHTTNTCANTITYLFKLLASSALYLVISKYNLSLHALPFNSTGLSSVEKSLLRVSAMASQSCGF